MAYLSFKKCHFEKITTFTLRVENIDSDVIFSGCSFFPCSCPMILRAHRVVYESVNFSMSSDLSVRSELYSSFADCDFHLSDAGHVTVEGQDTTFTNVFVCANNILSSALTCETNFYSLRFHN